ncbi:AAA family ATPase [Halorhodospira neutriphila]|uniref:Rad50/SbcC-type AAA domain-containing protein n=1 Tax=Halorhodospira neutriphila TaxID=168379 RepID=A0ABS1EAC4_9GAMM|nr:hypothetical protein [Halorhodospira neutriphila]
MQLQRVRVTNFRKLMGPVEIAELPPGLAVIGGGNEEGKSTLLEAIRAALFEKHGLMGEAARAMQPLGAAVAPEVELDFTVGGTEYRLWKRFVSKPRAELCGGGQTWADDAAEDQLQALLGFQRPGKGASKLEHHGLWGLLWVSQGETFEQPVVPNATARDSLAGVLDTEVGEVLGGDVGPRLLQEFATERDRFWTKAGKPRGELKEAHSALERARAAREAAEQRLHEEAERRERLERVEQERARMRAEGVVAQMEARQQAAEARQQELDQRRRAVEDAEQQAKLAATERAQAQERWQGRQTLRDAVADLAEQEANAEETVTARQGEAEQADAERDRLARALEAAETALDRHRARERHLEGLRRRQTVQAERDRVADTLAKATAAEAAAREARKAAGALAVTDQALQALRGQEQALGEAEARLQGAATQMELAVNVAYQVTGEAQGDGTGYRITGEAEVILDGVGRIQVQAGGAELPEQKEQARRARRERDAALDALGVATLAEAEDQLARKQAHEQEASNQDQRLAALAPEEAGGLAGLRKRLDQLDAELAGLPTPAEDDPDGEALAAACEQARQEREGAETARNQARQALDAQQQTVQAADNRLTQARTRLEEIQRNRARYQRQLNEARAEADDETLARALSDKQGQEEAATAAAREAREALDALDPEAIETEVAHARAAVTKAKEREQELEREADGLRRALRETGDEGLSEQVAELAREEEAAERQAAAVEREAAAVWRAAGALEEAAREARQAYLAPLNRYLVPYLRYLFPGAEPVLSDTLAVEGLQRGGQAEAFTQLSIGAREQVAVLTRLAFADLLAEAGGEAPPVILDDALVYADQERFDTMKHLLARSAQRHQVLVLTCRPMDYLSLGAVEFRVG